MDIVRYIPWDKSWIIRMGILDVVHRKDDIFRFLDSQDDLNDDLVALRRALGDWNAGRTIDVGESGTLYRFLKFASWRLNLDKEFVRQGTLESRSIMDDPSIVERSQEELLTLDNGTSQWASAAVLLGDARRLPDPPFKLQATYDAVEQWHERRTEGRAWEPRRDETILRQAEAFLALLQGGPSGFVPRQAEDFCFAFCFCGMTAAEGEARWPSLRGHESDRTVEIVRELAAAHAKREVTSRDHRVVQAIAMWGRIHSKKIKFAHPQAVAKSWPLFWRFLEGPS